MSCLELFVDVFELVERRDTATNRCPPMHSIAREIQVSPIQAGIATGEAVRPDRDCQIETEMNRRSRNTSFAAAHFRI
jgi:hypothetical protein